MTFDAELAERLRRTLAGEPDVVEKRMFGGLGFLVEGHLAVSASSTGGLMVRVEPAETAGLVEEAGARRMEMRGRAMDGWLHVDADAVRDDDVLATWVARGVRYARSLPPG